MSTLEYQDLKFRGSPFEPSIFGTGGKDLGATAECARIHESSLAFQSFSLTANQKSWSQVIIASAWPETLRCSTYFKSFSVLPFLLVSGLGLFHRRAAQNFALHIAYFENVLDFAHEVRVRH